MRAHLSPFSFLVISVAGWMNQKQQQVIDEMQVVVTQGPADGQYGLNLPELVRYLSGSTRGASDLLRGFPIDSGISSLATSITKAIGRAVYGVGARHADHSHLVRICLP